MGEEEEGNDNEEPEYLSDHTRSMRLASVYCQKAFLRMHKTNVKTPFILSLSQGNDGDNSNDKNKQEKWRFPPTAMSKLSFAARQEQQHVVTARRKARKEFWECQAIGEEEEYEPRKQQQSAARLSSSSCNILNSIKVPEIDIRNVSSTRDFRKQFHVRNLPCLINGWDGDDETESSSSFEYVNKKWKRNQQKRQCYYEWFLQYVGPETKVPLRYNPATTTSRAAPSSPSSSDEDMLDDEGRATECQTRYVTMNEWIGKMRANSSSSSNHDEDKEENNEIRPDDSICYYLKDWHLQLHLEQQQKQGLLPAQEEKSEESFLLYGVPRIFEYDLLNSFLRRFTNGDYRFCYWGPKHSMTARHADVLHSFSWSYNVVGTKEWTFFYNDDDDNNNNTETAGDGGENDDECSNHKNSKEKGGAGQQAQRQEVCFRFLQQAGQAVFVPSTWQHTVVNLEEETISINHNWITTANIDLTWNCLQTEMNAIQKELSEWGLNDNYESCESMLLGCVGLDVTAFVLMVLVRLLDLLVLILLVEEEEEDDVSVKMRDDPEHHWDIVRLSGKLDEILNDESVGVRYRLLAVLGDEQLATHVLEILNLVLQRVDESIRL